LTTQHFLKCVLLSLFATPYLVVHHTTKNVILLFFVNFSQTALFSSPHSRNCFLRTEYLKWRSRGRARNPARAIRCIPLHMVYKERHRAHW